MSFSSKIARSVDRIFDSFKNLTFKFSSLFREFNLPETAFLIPLENSTPTAPEYKLRWLAPTTEIDLCGHATLASAFHLFTNGLVEAPVTFHTRSGALRASRAPDGAKIQLNFPEEPALESKDEAEWEHVAKAFGIQRSDLVFMGRNRMDVLVEVTANVDIEKVEPIAPLLVGSG